MPLPAFVEYRVPLLLELVRAGGFLPASDAHKLVITHFPPGFISQSDLQETQPSTPRRRYQNHIENARQQLKEHGAIEQRSDGIWPIITHGRQLLRQDLITKHSLEPSRVEEAIASTRKLFEIDPSWKPRVAGPARQVQRGSRGSQVPPRPGTEFGLTQSSKLPYSPQPLDSSDQVGGPTSPLRSQLLQKLTSMTDRQFERFVGRLLETLGFQEVDVVGRSGDGGVDVQCVFQHTLIEPPMRLVCQVKRHNSNVGPSVVGDLRGRWALRADRLILVNLGGFTQGAREVAQEAGAKVVTLLSGEALVDLMLREGIGIQEKPVLERTLDESFLGQVPP